MAVAVVSTTTSTAAPASAPTTATDTGTTAFAGIGTSAGTDRANPRKSRSFDTDEAANTTAISVAQAARR